MSLHKYLLANSGIAQILSEESTPVTLEELLMSYCETNERFMYVVNLLEKLPEFETELIKTSNCMIDGTLPYDSLIGLHATDLNTLCELMDYLELPQNIYEKLEKVIDKDINWEPYTMEEFVKNGDLRGMKYLHKIKGIPIMTSTGHTAAIYGRLECLKYARAQGCSWNAYTCAYASLNGHLECLKYLRAQGCPWDEDTCKFAAKEGHLDCLKYAHEQGCSLAVWTCVYAAQFGHLECLKYAHTHGCTLIDQAYIMACNYKKTDCIKYLLENGCPH